MVYFSPAQMAMREKGIAESDIEYALRHPIKVEGRSFAPNKYNIEGLDKDGNKLRIGVSLEAERGGRLVVVTLTQTLSNKQMPALNAYLSKEDFAYVAGNMISEGKIIYSPRVQNYMDERAMTKNNLEYVLGHPVKVENRAAPGRSHGLSEYKIEGLDKEGNRVRMGVSLHSQEGGRLIVATVGQTLLNERVPVSRGAYRNFVKGYIQEGKGITYTRHARERMREQMIAKDDVKHALEHANKVGNLTHTSGPYMMGEARDGRPLRVGISFNSQEGKRLVVVTVAHFVKTDAGPEQGKIIYSDYARKRMIERTVSESDVEYALRHPIKVGKKYVMGLTKNGKQLHIGISSESWEGERLVVVTVARPLLDTLSMADFKSMVRDKIVQQKTVYSQNALKLMQENLVLPKDIERVLLGPFDIKKENMLPERPSGLDEYTIVELNQQDKMAVGIAFNNLHEMTITGVWRR